MRERAVFRPSSVGPQLLVVVGASALGLALVPEIAHGYGIESEPPWVTPIEVPRPPADRGEGGVHYLLVDRQVDASRKTVQRFYHHALQLTTVQAVTDNAQIEWDYDPDFESVTLHKVVVHRDGRALDRLKRAKIRVIQRESELNRQIYDGSRTLVVLPDDVRPGDTLEYSLTVRGINPVHKGRFTGSVLLQWSVTVERLFARVLSSKRRPLTYRLFAGGGEPRVEERGSTIEWIWDHHEVPASTSEYGRPPWHQELPWVQFTAYQTWNEVALWGSRLYRRPEPIPAELRSTAHRIRTEFESPVERAGAALHWVQNEFRYLGIELGAKSYRPHNVQQIIHQRFGDCKDKALLLVSLLELLDISAAPALVSTSWMRGVDGMAPSPTVFDHVIARVRVGEEIFWLDPSRQHQAGPLAEHGLPNYGFGLPLEPSTTALEEIPLRPEAGERIHVNYDFNLTSEPPRMSATTTFQGAAAERIRWFLEQNATDDIQSQYLEFYRAYYPDIEVAEPFRVRSDSSKNLIEVREDYVIRGLWLDGQGFRSASLIPADLFDVIQEPRREPRESPLAIDYPESRSAHLVAHLPEGMPIEPSLVEVISPAFRYQSDVSIKGPRTLVIDYEYTATTDHIAVADLDRHYDALDRAWADVGYHLSKPLGLSLADLNIANVVLLVLWLLGCAWGGWKLYHYDPPPRLGHAAEPSRIGGWMILPLISLFIGPPQFIGNILDLTQTVFSEARWATVNSPTSIDYHALSGPWILGSLLMNVFQACLDIVALVLFLSRRSSLPLVMVGVYAVNTSAVWVDAALALTISPETGGLETQIVGGFAGFIWIAYFLKSTRVRDTFLRRLSGNESETAEPEPADAF